MARVYQCNDADAGIEQGNDQARRECEQVRREHEQVTTSLRQAQSMRQDQTRKSEVRVMRDVIRERKTGTIRCRGRQGT